MKLHFSNEWLRRKIAADPDIDPEVDSSFVPGVEDSMLADNAAVVGDRVVTQLRIALGVFVRQLRSKARLSIPELAERACVSEEELRQVEHDPHYTASPYLIFQLSEFFSVPLANLSQMAGVTHEVNRTVYNAAVRYAARSDDVSILSSEEHEALDVFISVLNDTAKAKA